MPTGNCEKRIWTAEQIRAKLGNEVWLARAIRAIYEKQTPGEQAADATVEQNGVGFSGADAPFLSSLAKQLAEGRPLTERQRKAGEKAMQKYCGQLARIANGEI